MNPNPAHSITKVAVVPASLNSFSQCGTTRRLGGFLAALALLSSLFGDVHRASSAEIVGPPVTHRTVTVDPTRTFLRVNEDPDAKLALFIRLSELDIFPGDRILLERFGDFRYRASQPDTLHAMMAVFSTSDVLLPGDQLHRIPGAVSAGFNHFTQPTGVGFLDTDIPEDFVISSSVIVEVPAGANYLFYCAADIYYGDNADPEGDYLLSVTSLECRMPSGQRIVWDGGGDGTSWHDPLNWLPNAVPANCDDVVINGPVALVVRFSQGETHVHSLTLNATLAVQGGSLFVRQPVSTTGRFVVSGGSLEFINGATVSGSSFTQTDGRVATNVVLVDSALQLGDGSRGIGQFTLKRSCTLVGNLSRAQSVTLLAVGGQHSTVTAGASVTNHGRLVLASSGATAQFILNGSGKLVNAPSGSIEGTGVASGYRGINAAIQNEGLIVTDPAANLWIVLNAAQLIENNGGEVMLGSVMNVSGGGFRFNGGAIVEHPETLPEIVLLSLSNSRFHFVAGDNAVTTELISSGLVFESQATAPGDYIFRSSCTFAGNISPGQALTLGARGGSHATVTSSTSITNRGQIVLDSMGATAQFVMNGSGKLVNKADGIIEATGAASGYRGINSAVRNEGTLLTQPAANLWMALTPSQLLENVAGRIVLGGTLNVSGGGFHLVGGIIGENPDGMEELPLVVLSSSVFNYVAGTNRVRVQLNASGLTLAERAMTPGDYDFRGACTFSGNVSAGQTLTLEAGVSHSTVTTTASVTNHGHIILESMGATAQLVVNSPARLVNAADGVIEGVGVASAYRGINGSIRNEGRILSEPAANIWIALNPAQLLDNDGGEILLGGKLNVSGGAVQLNRGVIEPHLDAPSDIVALALSGSRFHYLTGRNSVRTELTDSALLFGPQARAPGDYVINSSCTLMGNISDRQTILLAARGNHSTLVASSSFTNRGQIVLDSQGASAQLVVNNGGRLVNESNGVVQATGVATGYRGINAAIRNHGLILTQPAADLRVILNPVQLLEQYGIVWLNNGNLTVSGNNFVNHSGGMIEGDGTIATANGSFVNHGVISPGGSIGMLAFTGSFAQGSNGTIRMDIAGTTPASEFDRLILPAGASLNGRLEAKLVGDFAPAIGSEFPVISASSYLGRFATVTSSNLNLGLSFRVRYDSNLVSLLTISPAALSFRPGGYRITNGVFTMTLAGTPDTRFIVEVSTNLLNWLPLCTNAIGSDGLGQCPDSGASNYPRRFYRSFIIP